MSQDFDNIQASSEGWAIFECNGFADGKFQLQKCDDAEVFEDDYAAWKFVGNKAKEGSEYHQSALDYLEAHNNREFVAITQFVALGIAL